MNDDRLWWCVFTLAFVITGIAETFLPIRSLPSSTVRRWTSNSVLFATSGAVALFAYQLSGIALAFSVRADSYGVLNQGPVPYGFRFAIGLLAIDLTHYASHRLFHSLAPLWRVHQVHHSETDMDMTTGFRFHPIEALFSQGLALLTIALLGLPPGAVFVSALLVVVQDFFEHANVRIPEKINYFLGLIIITPTMHHTHHSEVVAEQNTNFGTVFSIWDRIFGTYRTSLATTAQPTRCGLTEIANGSNLNAADLLAMPFRGIFRRKPQQSLSPKTPI